MTDELSILDVQNAIIKMQSDVIYDLFQVLAQYITSEELDELPCVQKINEAAGLRSQIRKYT